MVGRWHLACANGFDSDCYVSLQSPYKECCLKLERRQAYGIFVALPVTGLNNLRFENVSIGVS
jgi:hypothetical protein